MKKRIFLFLIFLYLGVGCSKASSEDRLSLSKGGPVQNKSAAVAPAADSPAQETQQAPQAAASPQNPQPFKIYTDKASRDNHYVPSGFMPDGKCLALDDAWQKDCHSGAVCIRIEYDIECSKEGAKWAGIYWLNPANNWGSQKGGFNLTGVQKLTFWAKGENGDERIEEFKVGGIMGEYPDSDTAVIGPVILTKEWKEYTIDLRGKDLSYMSGGFAWATNVDVNPEKCVFYLDDIQYQ